MSDKLNNIPQDAAGYTPGMLSHIKNFLFLSKNGVKYKKTAFIYGYYCMNLGDDLFLETVIRRYPDVLFLVLFNSDYYDFFSKFENVKFYSYESNFVKSTNSFGHKIKVHDLFEYLLLLRSNAVVHIGGAIYQQTPEYVSDYNIRKRRSGFGRRFFSLSSNFGPYYSDDFYSMWKKMFRKGYDICFREKYSYELFKDVSSVRYAPDVLFSFKCEPKEVIKGSVVISIINPFLEVRHIPGDIAAAYKTAVVNTVIRLAEQKHSVKLLGFCKIEGDGDFITEVMAEIPDALKEYVEVLIYEFSNRDKTVNMLASSEYIIGTRLHSIILGFAMGKKVLPIVYDRKVTNIFEDIDFTGKSVNLADLKDYGETGLADLLKDIKPFDKSSVLADSAGLQFKKLDKLLK